MGSEVVDSLMLGFIQGICEWLPISSKTMVMLYSLFILRKPLVISYTIGLALQGGTVFVVLTYFWREIFDMISMRNRRLFVYLVTVTLSTSLTGLPLYILFKNFLVYGEEVLGVITIAIGLLLLAQALILSRLRPGTKKVSNVYIVDSFILGLAQGLSVIPGVSRSGITITTLLYLGYVVDDSLKLSFLASIPVNLGATIITLILEKPSTAHLNAYSFSLAFLVSTIVGFTTIKLLLSIAKKYSYRLTAVLGVVTLVIGLATTLAKY